MANKFKSDKQRKYVMMKLKQNVSNDEFLYGDWDGDGVPNYRDCRPLDPDKQDIRGEAPPEVQAYIRNDPSYREMAHRMDMVHLGSSKSDFGTTEYHEFGVVPKGEEFKSQGEGRRGATIHYGKKEGFEKIPRKQGLVYRGMSWAEYQNAKSKGYFKSRGGHNIGVTQEGATCGSTDPETAMVYASSFAPMSKKPTPEEPGVVVAFKETDDWCPNLKHTHSSTERQNLDVLKFSDAEEIYIFQLEEFTPAHMEIWNELGQLKTGSRNTPDVKGKWKRVK